MFYSPPRNSQDRFKVKDAFFPTIRDDCDGSCLLTIIGRGGQSKYIMIMNIDIGTRWAPTIVINGVLYDPLQMAL